MPLHRTTVQPAGPPPVPRLLLGSETVLLTLPPPQNPLTADLHSAALCHPSAVNSNASPVEGLQDPNEAHPGITLCHIILFDWLHSNKYVTYFQPIK